MGTLIPWERGEDTDRAKPPPVDDAIACAAWLHQVLCEELHEVRCDHSLTTKERREEIARLASKITVATPNFEIFKAREQIRAEENRSKESKLSGKVVKRVKASGARSLRANAPRR